MQSPRSSFIAAKLEVNSVSATTEPDVQDDTVNPSPLDSIRSTTTPDDPGAPAPAAKKLGKIWNRSMKLIRRIHLYSGIFMFPFVLMYGFTGWFFNHPRYFTGDEVHTFNSAVAGGVLNELPSPDEMAKEVVDELNIESFMVDGPEVKLTDARQPQYSSFLTYTVNAEGASHQVSIDPISGKGEIRTTFSVEESPEDEEPPPRNPLAAVTQANIQNNAMADVQAAVPQILKELDLPSAEAFAGRRPPSLVFSADVDGTPTMVTYNLGNGSVSGLREDAESTMETKSFLQRLHMARMYSPHVGSAKWLWALQVDFMFVSMVFWGLSGLLMWWQIKRTRWLGTGFLIASIVSATVLTVGMHDNLSKSSRGRGGGGGGGHSSVQPAAPASMVASAK